MAKFKISATQENIINKAVANFKLSNVNQGKEIALDEEVVWNGIRTGNVKELVEEKLFGEAMGSAVFDIANKVAAVRARIERQELAVAIETGTGDIAALDQQINLLQTQIKHTCLKLSAKTKDKHLSPRAANYLAGERAKTQNQVSAWKEQLDGVHAQRAQKQQDLKLVRNRFANSHIAPVPNSEELVAAIEIVEDGKFDLSPYLVKNDTVISKTTREAQTLIERTRSLLKGESDPMGSIRLPKAPALNIDTRKSADLSSWGNDEFGTFADAAINGASTFGH